MVQNSEKKRIRVKWRVNFLKEKDSILFQYPGYFRDSLLPVFQMVDYSEIKNSVKTVIGERQFLSIC